MSALRLGRLSDGTRHVVILEPAIGRTSFSRGAMRNAGEYVVGASAKYSGRVDPRQGKHAPKVPDAD